MFTAIKSFFLFILGAAVLIILFFLGLIFFVRGILKKPLAEYEGKKTPAVFMIIGATFMLLPVAAFVVVSTWSISSSVSTIYNRANYECIPDIWRHESVSQLNAEEEILKALLISADRDNREAFRLNFTPEMQRKDGFDKAVDDFFKNYPVGLSECKKNNKIRDDSVSSDAASEIRTDSLSFRCTLDDVHYFVAVEYCYRNDKAPDKVGVTKFMVMNLEAAAAYFDDEPAPGKESFPVCVIKSSSEVNARLIGGSPYLWNTTDTSMVTADQVRILVKDGGRLDSMLLKVWLGEPGIGIKRPESTDYGYFYEIAPENGEPRYVYFQTDSEFGNILWALLCTPYEVKSDKPLYQAEQ